MNEPTPKTLPVINPRTGQADYSIPNHDADYLAARAGELRQAQPAWQDLGTEQRCAILMQWKAAIERHAGDIIDALCIDTGRHLMAQFETITTLHRIEHWATRAPALLGDPGSGQSALAPGVAFRYQRIPYPVVGIISPWNVPITLALIDAIPALAAGCSVLLKPSEITPRFAEPLQRATEEIPELARVLKFVSGGAQTGQALIDNVDVICFTGSVETGRKVAAQAAANFIPAFLELGGKDPAIVLPSADLDNAANAILRSACGLTGQACQSLERVYVHQDVFDAFLETLIAKADRIRPNYPDLHSGHVGPFIFGPQGEKVQSQLDQALSLGAHMVYGQGVQNLGGGCYCLPVILTEVNHDMAIMREETFGPVLPVMPFSSVDEAVSLANDSTFGLSAAVFAGTREEGEAVAERITAGAVSVNDASLTVMVNDVEKNSFCLSGMGGSRMGDAGLTRFFRKKALLYQSEPAATLESFDEANAR